jgi:hypothetical protein
MFHCIYICKFDLYRIPIYSGFCLDRFCCIIYVYWKPVNMKCTASGEIFNLTCINQTPVYSEHKSCSQVGYVKTCFTVYIYVCLL